MMDPILHALVAFLMAVSAAAGLSVDGADSPDHPAIIAPATATLSIEPSRTPAIGFNGVVAIRGTIQRVQNNAIVVDGMTVSVAPGFQVTGLLKVGTSVQVVAARRSDGTLEAREVRVDSEQVDTATPTVFSGIAGATPTGTPGTKPTEPPEVKPTETSGVKPTEPPEVKPTETPEAKPTEKPEVKPTEKPEVKPTEKPEVKPTEKPEVKPTEKPEVKPTETPEPPGK